MQSRCLDASCLIIGYYAAMINGRSTNTNASCLKYHVNIRNKIKWHHVTLDTSHGCHIIISGILSVGVLLCFHWGYNLICISQQLTNMATLNSKWVILDNLNILQTSHVKLRWGLLAIKLQLGMADLRLRLNLLWLIIHHTISPHNVHHTEYWIFMCIGCSS